MGLSKLEKSWRKFKLTRNYDAFFFSNGRESYILMGRRDKACALVANSAACYYYPTNTLNKLPTEILLMSAD